MPGWATPATVGACLREDTCLVIIETPGNPTLKVIDIANPHAPKEVASFMPDVAPVARGEARVQSNDVTVDDRGLIYLLDRVHGLNILERA